MSRIHFYNVCPPLTVCCTICGLPIPIFLTSFVSSAQQQFHWQTHQQVLANCVALYLRTNCGSHHILKYTPRLRYRLHREVYTTAKWCCWDCGARCDIVVSRAKVYRKRNSPLVVGLLCPLNNVRSPTDCGHNCVRTKFIQNLFILFMTYTSISLWKKKTTSRWWTINFLRWMRLTVIIWRY